MLVQKCMNIINKRLKLILRVPLDVIFILDLPRGKKGCAGYKKPSCQYLDTSLKSVNILVQINLTG